MRLFIKSAIVALVAGIGSLSAQAVTLNRDISILEAADKGGSLPFEKNGTVPVSNGAEAVTSVNLAGYRTFDTGFPGALNTQALLTLSPSAQITAVSFTNLSIRLSNGSFGEEFVISTNTSANSGNAGTFWDYRPFPNDDGDPIVLGPISGSFTAPSNQFDSGPFPLLADGRLLLYVYENFNDGGAAIDAEVISGTLNITFIPIPEPTTLAALAGAGVMALARRRRA